MSEYSSRVGEPHARDFSPFVAETLRDETVGSTRDGDEAKATRRVRDRGPVEVGDEDAGADNRAPRGLVGHDADNRSWLRAGVAEGERVARGRIRRAIARVHRSQFVAIACRDDRKRGDEELRLHHY